MVISIFCIRLARSWVCFFKEIVADPDTSIAGEVTEKMKGIYAADQSLKAQVENEAIHGQIEPITAAAAEYEAAFNGTVDLMTFLSDGLVNHIKGVDRKYPPALKRET